MDHEQAQRTPSRNTKIDLIIDFSRGRISEIKLKRTDTTLDLSRKAKRAKEEGERSVREESGIL